MPRSFAKQHKAKVLAKIAAEETQKRAKKIAAGTVAVLATAAGLVGVNFDVVLAQFERHCEQLKALADVDKKEDFKKNIIAEYIEYLADYAQSKQQYKNPVLSRLIFWLVDINDIANAMLYAKLAIAQQQLAPGGFKRDLTTAFVETVHDWAERQFKAGNSAEPYLTEVAELCLNNTWIVSEPIVLNKLYKLLGLYADKAENHADAVKWFEHCVAVNPQKHGVKGKLEAAKEKLAQQN